MNEQEHDEQVQEDAPSESTNSQQPDQITISADEFAELKARLENSVPKEQVTEIVKDRLKRAKRGAQKPSADEPPPWLDQIAEQQKGLADTVSKLMERFEQREQETQQAKFEAAFAQSGLPERLKDFVKNDIEKSKPQNIAERLGELKEAMGIAGQQEQPVGQAKPSNGSQMPGRSPAGAHSPDLHEIPPWRWSREDVDRLMSSGKLIETAEKWRSSRSKRR